MNSEKQKLKIAKSVFNSNKKNFPVLYTNLRNEVIEAVVRSKTPNWGSIRLTVTTKGI